MAFTTLTSQQPTPRCPEPCFSIGPAGPGRQGSHTASLPPPHSLFHPTDTPTLVLHYFQLQDLLDQDGKDAPAVNQALAAMKEAVYGMDIDRRVTTLEVRQRASLEGKQGWGKGRAGFRGKHGQLSAQPGARMHFESSGACMAQPQDRAHLTLL